ncbi:hypothetical protein HOY82DRAFT_601355 [Tuber indicum]|nr:hypothetical protein HOY82DRAFT_601355 [Tuber indicum]
MAGWILGHAGVGGNELADRAAKEGLRLPVVDVEGIRLDVRNGVLAWGLRKKQRPVHLKGLLCWDFYILIRIRTGAEVRIDHSACDDGDSCFHLTRCDLTAEGGLTKVSCLTTDASRTGWLGGLVMTTETFLLHGIGVALLAGRSRGLGAGNCRAPSFQSQNNTQALVSPTDIPMDEDAIQDTPSPVHTVGAAAPSPSNNDAGTFLSFGGQPPTIKTLTRCLIQVNLAQNELTDRFGTME